MAYLVEKRLGMLELGHGTSADGSVGSRGYKWKNNKD